MTYQHSGMVSMYVYAYALEWALMQLICRTSRALVTQMFDTQDWTTVADKREDRQEYSDILDEDTGFSEVAKIYATAQYMKNAKT